MGKRMIKLYEFYKKLVSRLMGGNARQPMLPFAVVETVEVEPVAPEDGERPAERPWNASEIDRYFHQWLVDLDAFVEQPLSDSEARALDTLEQMVTGKTSSTHLVPRLPTVIPQLMRDLKDEKMTGAQLARQISRDPALVGEVIRLANSPYYRRSQKIANIEQAVVLIGQDGLRQLISRVVFYPILNLRSGPLTRLAGARIWSQSEKCAVVCRCLANRNQADAFAAYLAGLVSKVGMIVGLHLMDQLLNTKQEGIPRSEDFYRVFLDLASRFSHRIVEDWGFPDAVVLAIGEQARRGVDEAFSPLGRILSLSDQYSKIGTLEEHCRLPDDVDLAAVASDPCYVQLSLPTD